MERTFHFMKRVFDFGKKLSILERTFHFRKEYLNFGRSVSFWNGAFYFEKIYRKWKIDKKKTHLLAMINLT